MTRDHLKSDIDRATLIRTAFVLEWLTLGWVFIIEALGGLWAAMEAHSLSLLAFGADSIIETISACLLLGDSTSNCSMVSASPSVPKAPRAAFRAHFYLPWRLM